MTIREPSTLFDEILEFLASTPTPETIIAFSPSERLQARASSLLEKNRAGILTSAETAELDEFERMEHFMSSLRIKARQKITGS